MQNNGGRLGTFELLSTVLTFDSKESSLLAPADFPCGLLAEDAVPRLVGVPEAPGRTPGLPNEDLGEPGRDGTLELEPVGLGGTTRGGML